MFLSIVVFCYNEAGNIQMVISNVLEFMESNFSEFEVIIVNDGSLDGSDIIIESFGKLHPVKVNVIHHPRNLGIGMALQTGYKSARGEYVCAIPGDGQFDINQLLQVRPFGDSAYYSFYRINKGYNSYRKLLTWMNRKFNSLFLGIQIKDVNWIKVYRKTQLNQVKPELISSLVESEICAKLNIIKANPIELPSSYLKRISGEPKGGNWRTLKRAASETWKLFWLIQKYKLEN